MVTVLEGYLSPSAAARRIGVAPLTLKLWARSGKIPALMTPNGIVFKVEDIDRIAHERAEKDG